MIQSEEPVLIRTDFSDDGLWDVLCQKVRAEQEEFVFQLNLVNNLDYKDLDESEIVALLAQDQYAFFALFDKDSTLLGNMTVKVCDLFEVGKSFRALPETLQMIENNLSIGNMSFDDYANNVNEQGYFVGFK